MHDLFDKLIATLLAWLNNPLVLAALGTGAAGLTAFLLWPRRRLPRNPTPRQMLAMLSPRPVLAEMLTLEEDIGADSLKGLPTLAMIESYINRLNALGMSLTCVRQHLGTDVIDVLSVFPHDGLVTYTVHIEDKAYRLHTAGKDIDQTQYVANAQDLIWFRLTASGSRPSYLILGLYQFAVTDGHIRP